METDISAGRIARPLKPYHRLLPALAAVLLLTGGLLWWRYTIDDSYISLRYAENLARGKGPVFNPGERTEGYSCPLWVFLLGLTQWMGGDPLSAAKAIGLLSALGVAGLLYGTLRRRQCDPFLAGMATLWFAVLPGVHVYACSGMETLPFALAVAATVALPGLCFSAPRRSWLIPISLLAVATLRPEGLLLFAVVSALWWRGESSRQVRAGIAVAGIALLGLLLLRCHYYGCFFPNTYLAKPSPLVHAITTAPLETSTLNLIFISYAYPLAALNSFGGTGLILCAILALALRETDLGLLTAAAAIVVGGLFLFYVPADWMPEYRFGLPFAFPILFLAALCLDSLRRLVSAENFRKIRTALVLVLGVWCLFNVGATLGLWLRYRHGHINTALDAARYVAIGKWLREHSAEDDRVLTYEPGAIAYFSKRYIVDHEGLVTADIARVIHEAGGYTAIREGYNKAAIREIVAHCVARKPDWFLVRSSTDLPLTVLKPLPKEAAGEPLQQALVEALGPSMVLRQVFPMQPQDATSRDKYLLLQRRTAAEAR